jgi:hypothetical protein
MRRQLAYLREQAARPNIMIRLKPFTTGTHAAFGSTFSVLDFDADIDCQQWSTSRLWPHR